MNLTDARFRVRDNARSAGDSSSYSSGQVDRAISSICNRFCRVTKALKTVSSFSLTIAQSTIDLTAITGDAASTSSFRPERLISGYLTDAPSSDSDLPRLDVVDWEELLRLQIKCPRTAVPQKIAFQTWPPGAADTALYPTPAAAYTLKLRWWMPFTLITYPGCMGAYSSSATYYPGDVVASGGHAWRAKKKVANSNPAANASWDDLGAAAVPDPASITLNLPGDWLSEILADGAPARLQLPDVEQEFAAPAWKRYTDFETSMMGAGGLGVKEVRRRGGCERRIPRTRA